MRLRLLRLTLAVVIAFQLFFAVALLVSPAGFAAALGLPAAPGWTAFLFALFSARALGFAYGLGLAMREPHRHRSWITAMIGVQAVDWIAAMATVASGVVALSQVATASFMPLVFIAGMLAFYPRGAATDPVPAASSLARTA
ncbi:hypothetical protein [Demequina mangrovi]|uniref:Uncharacterized protein n=1 Tax=Demequina mangrovi TaxID=1043493 RepID=A0A1H6YEL8_9MICO|nr:hypothetical protein [Demequina mangrovi]SEJ35630.1 hypothetical protein SAMN05421637_1541 [Demequina mangrovi]